MGNDLLRILMVDDDKDDYILTQDLLSEIADFKYDLEWVSTYDKALEVMENNTYDICLLDYQLGRRNGMELLREMIEKGCATPIIFMTGQGDHKVDMEAMKAGASDYLPKGEINASLLGRSIRYALERQKAKEQILHLAYYDALTNLSNRILFKDRLKQILCLSERYQRLSALMFLDIDNFKRINDTLGHNEGDLLLKEVAARLVTCLRTCDSVSRECMDKLNATVSRLGGDEFTVLLSEINEYQDAAKVAKRILEVLSQPFVLSGHEVFITASIGITLIPLDSNNIDTLLKNADTAMYSAKSRGRNNYQFYKNSMNATASKQLALENNLRKALKREEFLLYYQPQLDISTGKIIGTEALIRWQHPERGIVFPNDFIPLAEQTGMIIPITEWVLKKACAQNKAWQEQGLPLIPVSVNLSAQDFKEESLIDTMVGALDESGLDPHYLELEITENTVMYNIETTIGILKRFKEMGVRLTMDDFGTGFSSLVNLKHFSLNSIKIARIFVNDITTSSDGGAIVTAIIAMARSLRLNLIAEGVETYEQLRFVFNQGCDVMQGFLLSPALPANDMLNFLAKEDRGAGLGQLIYQKITRNNDKKIPPAVNKPE